MRKPRANTRADHSKGHRAQFEKNRAKVIQANDICALCGMPVDKRIKYPHPLSATVDHIIPVSRGGHPSSIDNLQLAHLKCNRDKWDKIAGERKRPGTMQPDQISVEDPRAFEWSFPWDKYRADENGNNSEELAREMDQNHGKGFMLTADGWIRRHRSNKE